MRRLILYISACLVLFALLFVITKPSVQQDASAAQVTSDNALSDVRYAEPEPLDATNVPLTEWAGDATCPYSIAYTGDPLSSDELTFGVAYDGSFYPMPSGYLPQKILPDVDGRCYVFAKKLCTDNVRLFSLTDGRFSRIPLRKGMEDFIFCDACYFEDDVEKSLYFTLFNTHSNVFQVFRIIVEEKSLVFDDAFCRDLTAAAGGIDDRVTMLVTAPLDCFNGRKGLVIATRRTLFCHYVWNSSDWVTFTAPTGTLITDISADIADVPVYLAYHNGNRTYSLCHFDGEVIETVTAKRNQICTIDVIHDLEGVRAYKIRSVSDKASYVANLRSQLMHSAICRLQDTGSTMADGRAPWGQVYYLNALLDLQTPAFNALRSVPGFTQLRQDALARLQLELRLMDQTFSNKDALLSRRYTIARQPAVFSMLIQRILQLWDRYNFYCPDISFANRDSLYGLATSFDGTVEQLRYAEADDHYFKEGTPYLFFDGPMTANQNVTPYNYMSAWSSSVLQRQLLCSDVSPKTLYTAKQMLTILTEADSFTDYDEAHLWSYWPARMYYGWEYDNKQYMRVNPGQKQDAGIIYRTMDSEALLLRMSVFPDTYDQALLDYLCEGIANGTLPPCLNTTMLLTGHAAVQVEVTDTLRVYLTPLVTSDYLSLPWATLAACQYTAPIETEQMGGQ